MNAVVTIRDEQGRHTVRLMGFENLGAFVRGFQKVGSSLIKRTIEAPEIVEIEETGKTKLREIAKLSNVHIMFRNGDSLNVERFIDEGRDPVTGVQHTRCIVAPNEYGHRKSVRVQSNSPVTVIFD